MPNIRYLLVFLLWLSQPFDVFAQGLEAGYIQQVYGHFDSLIVKHNGKESKPAPLTPLYAGDTIVAQAKKTNDNRMILTIDQQVKTLFATDFPYTVPRPKGAASIAGNVMHMMKAFFVNLQKRYAGSAVMTGRGWLPPLALPAVMTKAGKIQAGKHSLILQWEKSKSPYQITLFQGQRRIQTRSTSQLSIQLAGYDFSNGDYQLFIQDANGRSRTSPFTVVTTAPSMPQKMHDELANAMLTTEVKKTLYMAWLIQQDSQWKLEAYQSLCAAPQANATVLLCRSLVVGKTRK